MPGSMRRASSSGLIRSTCRTCSISPGVSTWKRVCGSVAALLTSTSMLPSSAVAASATCRAACGPPRSITAVLTLMAPPRSPARRASSFSERATSSRFIRRAARARAMYCPMPCAPFACPSILSGYKIILLQDNLGERRDMGNSATSRRQTGRMGQLLFVAQQAAQALAIERLEPLGLSPRAWGVLSTLAESGPLTQIELATTMAIDRTAMVYLLNDLERRKLVERVRSPQDRRAFMIHLTAAGRAAQRRAAAALDGAAETLLTPLDAADRRHLIDLLARIATHWQQLSATQPHPGTKQAAPKATGNK